MAEKLNQYELFCLTPEEASELLLKEVKKDEPDLELIDEIVKWSVVDLNRTEEDEYGLSVLNYAKDSELKEFFLKSGANPNVQNSSGRTELWWATPELAELYIKYGADPNVQDRCGWTALMSMGADNKDTFKLAEILLKNGADPNMKNTTGGGTALSIATYHFAHFGWMNSYRITQLLLEYGADPNVKDDDGSTALLNVARFGSYVHNGAEKISELLLKAGADPNVQDDKGYTALMWAKKLRKDGIVKLLLEAGADPDLKDNKGKKALDLDTWIEFHMYSDEGNIMCTKVFEKMKKVLNKGTITKDEFEKLLKKELNKVRSKFPEVDDTEPRSEMVILLNKELKEKGFEFKISL